ncbi:ribonuclease P protein component [Lysobacter xanthus]
MNQLRHPRSARVRTRADFDRVFKDGRRTGLPFLALHWHADPAGHVRLGLAVSRKVDKTAVGRNRIKRQLREAFRHVRGQLPPGDYVLVARPGAAQRDGLELRAGFLDLLRRARALPPPAPAGTMPPPPSSPSADADARPA